MIRSWKRTIFLIVTSASLMIGYRKGLAGITEKEKVIGGGNDKGEEHLMDIQESLQSTIHTLPNPAAAVENMEPGYFLEEVYHTHSRESDYWLGKYGKDQRAWIGESDRMTLEQAINRAKEMLERGIRVF